MIPSVTLAFTTKSFNDISNRSLNDVEDLLKKLQEKGVKESSHSSNFDELIDQSFESLMNNEKYNENNVLHKWLKEEIYRVIALLNEEEDENIIKEQQASLKDKIGPQNAFSVLACTYALVCILKKKATGGDFDRAITQLDKALKELAAEVINVYKPTNIKLIFDSNAVNPEFLKQLQASEAKQKRLIYCGLASIAALGTLWIIYSKLNQPVDIEENITEQNKENVETNKSDPKHNETKLPVVDGNLTKNVNEFFQNSSSNTVELKETISNDWPKKKKPTEGTNEALSSIPTVTLERSVSPINRAYGTSSNANWKYQIPMTEIQNPDVQKDNAQRPGENPIDSSLTLLVGMAVGLFSIILGLVKSTFSSQQKESQTDRKLSDSIDDKSASTKESQDTTPQKLSTSSETSEPRQVGSQEESVTLPSQVNEKPSPQVPQQADEDSSSSDSQVWSNKKLFTSSSSSEEDKKPPDPNEKWFINW